MNKLHVCHGWRKQRDGPSQSIVVQPSISRVSFFETAHAISKHLNKIANELWDRPSERVRFQKAGMILTEVRQQKRRKRKENMNHSNERNAEISLITPKAAQTPISTKFNTRRIIVKLQVLKIRHASKWWNRSSQVIVRESASKSAQQQSHQQTNQQTESETHRSGKTESEHIAPAKPKARMCEKTEWDRTRNSHAIVSLTASPDWASQRNWNSTDRLIVRTIGDSWKFDQHRMRVTQMKMRWIEWTRRECRSEQ